MPQLCLTVAVGWAVFLAAPALPAQPQLVPILPTGHTNSVECVALSADGKLLATGSADRTAILWESATGKVLRTFRGHSGWIRAVALSGDGRLLATGSDDRTVILWDTATGKKLHTLLGHRHWIKGVALSGNGKLLVTGSRDGTAILWDTVRGERIHVLRDHTAEVLSVAISEDGKVMATGSMDSTAIAWDTATGKPIKTLRSPTGQVRGLSLSSNGKSLATVAGRGWALWEVANGKAIQKFRGEYPTWFISASLSGDGKLLATGGGEEGESKVAALWDADSGKLLLSFKSRGEVTGVSLSRDGKLLATTAPEKLGASLRETVKGTLLGAFQPTTEVLGIALSGDGKLVATASHNRPVVVWDLTAGRPINTLPMESSVKGGGVVFHSGPWASFYLSMSRDGKRLATGASSKPALLWDMGEGKQPRTLCESLGEPCSVMLSGDGKRLAATKRNGTVGVWDAASGKELFVVERDRDRAAPVYLLSLSENGALLATGEENGRVTLWDTVARKKRVRFWPHGKLTCLSLSGDGKWLATGTSDKTVFVWDADGKQCCALRQAAPVLRVSLSDDGKLLAAVGADWTVILWDTTREQKLHTLRGHPQPITGVSFSADGRLLGTASADGTARLWDTVSGAELCALISIDSGNDWLVVSPDGSFDGSRGAWRHVVYREAGKDRLVDDDATRQRLHRPGLLGQLLRSDRPTK